MHLLLLLSYCTFYYLYIFGNPGLDWCCVLNLNACKCSNLTCSFLLLIFKTYKLKTIPSLALSHHADDVVSSAGERAAASGGAAGAAGAAGGGLFVFMSLLTGARRANGAKASSDQQKRTNVLPGYRISIGPPRVTESHLKPNFAAHKQGRAARSGGEELFKAAVLQCKDCRWRRRWLQISR